MTRPLKIEIETSERGLEVDFFDRSSFTAGATSKTLPDGSTVTYEGSLIRKTFGTSEVLHLAINLAEGIGTSVVGNWLGRQAEG
jgi:hypothetical protein